MSNQVFEWKYGGNNVLIAGSFNNWKGTQMKKVKDKWVLSQKLETGVHQYKFIVDGKWQYDILLPNMNDGNGNWNNFVAVTERSVPEKSQGQKSGKEQKNPRNSTGKKPNTDGKQSNGKKQNTVVKQSQELVEPPYWEYRVKMWDEIKKKTEIQVKSDRKPISITLPDGSVKQGISGETTPLDIAQSISNGLAQAVVAAKVDGNVYDSFRPLENDCTLELIKFDSEEGKKVFWHSSAHVLGQALEYYLGGRLCVGPPLKTGGFYYDISTTDDTAGDQRTFSEDDYEKIEHLVNEIVKKKQPFERLTLTKQEAIDMFKYNKFKVELICDKVKDGETCTAYRCGPLIDLCKGPHLPNTGKIACFSVWKNASAYWKGDSDKDSLQRIYGMSFPDKKQLNEWKKEQELLKERDHRIQGKKQDLFFFHPLSPGCCFFLPRGAKLYNKLVNFIRRQYRKRGFTEVISPNMFNKDLWEKSGHWAHYKNDMFSFVVEKQDFALKPMNCPGHCLMYLSKKRTYRELPIRFSDFGVLHRNELSGTLTGLTRVRRFCQDDAHIFCRSDQISEEISECFDFLKHVYKIFGFSFTLELSTRPEKKYIGDLKTWEMAEKSLEDSLNKFVGKGSWKLNPGDGAFYGPKIDIHVFDVYKREHQCATIQLDFNLPSKNHFDLSFMNEDNSEEKPVMIHRAIFGSIERFLAILIENTGGKWPFWLSPRQSIICTVARSFNDYAQEVYNALFLAGFEPELDISDRKLPKKIREAQVAGYNFILVIGEKEVESRTVNVRTNDNVVHGVRSVEELIREWSQLISEVENCGECRLCKEELSESE